jgi:hypothetical protein
VSWTRAARSRASCLSGAREVGPGEGDLVGEGDVAGVLGPGGEGLRERDGGVGEGGEGLVLGLALRGEGGLSADRRAERGEAVREVIGGFDGGRDGIERGGVGVEDGFDGPVGGEAGVLVVGHGRGGG